MFAFVFWNGCLMIDFCRDIAWWKQTAEAEKRQNKTLFSSWPFPGLSLRRRLAAAPGSLSDIQPVWPSGYTGVTPLPLDSLSVSQPPPTN
jgi:hypothetical protein